MRVKAGTRSVCVCAGKMMRWRWAVKGGVYYLDGGVRDGGGLSALRLSRQGATA